MHNDLKSVLSKTDYEVVVEFKKKLTGELPVFIKQPKIYDFSGSNVAALKIPCLLSIFGCLRLTP
jgi:hypothetical protein